MATDDFASGMMGIVGTTALIGVGAAAGMATVKAINRMSDQIADTPKRKRARARKNKYCGR